MATTNVLTMVGYLKAADEATVAAIAAKHDAEAMVVDQADGPRLVVTLDVASTPSTKADCVAAVRGAVERVGGMRRDHEGRGPWLENRHLYR